MRHGMFHLILGVVLLLWPGGYGESQEPAGRLPQQDCREKAAVLDIAAARMTFDRQEHSFLFEDQVQVRRCGMTILCDRLQVISDETGENVEHIIATGHVRVQQGTRHIVAEYAEYFAAEQRLVFTGKPRVWDTQERHEVTGEEIVILLSEDHVLVKRARVLLHLSTKPSTKEP